jgi:hypothetical protein
MANQRGCLLDPTFTSLSEADARNSLVPGLVARTRISTATEIEIYNRDPDLEAHHQHKHRNCPLKTGARQDGCWKVRNPLSRTEPKFDCPDVDGLPDR